MTNSNPSPSVHDPQTPPGSSAALHLITVVFLALTAWFLVGPRSAHVPLAPAADVADADIRPGPRRLRPPARAVLEVAGFDMKCMECHRHIDSAPETTRRLMQHENIVLDHGLNDRCFNCHDRTNRNLLALRGTRTVAFSDVELLCATCHASIYRDWKHGVHGQTVGAWDPDRGEQRRRRCLECHDPHVPAFGTLKPLPGPNTLRMGAPRPHPGEEATATRDPLRYWPLGPAKTIREAEDTGEEPHD